VYVRSESAPAGSPWVGVVVRHCRDHGDHFLIGCYLRRKVRFMAKSQLFKRPMQFIYTHGGVFPVRRGARDEETFVTAETILGKGGAVVMYCEGGRSRTGKLSERAKPGIGRLVLQSGAPVVPIAVHGSSRIRNWKRLQFPRVTVQYGDALRWAPIADPTREQQQAVADEILAEIRRLYAGLQQHGRRGILKQLRAGRRAGPGAPRGAAVRATADVVETMFMEMMSFARHHYGEKAVTSPPKTPPDRSRTA